MGRARIWKDYMVEYLTEAWGVRSTRVIAENLNLKKSQVVRKAHELKLGGAYCNGLLNKAQVCSILKMKSETISKLDIPFRKRKMISQMMYFIKTEDLLDWLEDNQDKFKASKIEKFAFGVEPEWLEEKRRSEDRLNLKWTPSEIATLKEMYRHDIPYSQIAIELKRTVSAVKRKMNAEKDFLSKHRRIDWTLKEMNDLKYYFEQGLTVKQIAKKMNRTSSSVENKKYLMGLRTRDISKKTRECLKGQIRLSEDKYIGTE